MRFIDPHIHMTARTTDDYERMAAAGVVAVIEPAFWLGQPRTSVGTFVDYLSTIVGWERFRAAQFGIRHYCAIGLNSKEANNEALAEQVLDILPRYLTKEGVVAVGEIGYDDQTDAEDKYYRAQLEMAKSFDMLVMVHTPHRDKKRGTTAQHGNRTRAWHQSRARGHRPQQRRDRRRSAGSRLLGGIYDLSAHQDGQRAHGRHRAPLWHRITSSSIRAPIGASPIRSRCRRRRG